MTLQGMEDTGQAHGRGSKGSLQGAGPETRPKGPEGLSHLRGSRQWPQGHPESRDRGTRTDLRPASASRLSTHPAADVGGRCWSGGVWTLFRGPGRHVVQTCPGGGGGQGAIIQDSRSPEVAPVPGASVYPRNSRGEPSGPEPPAGNADTAQVRTGTWWGAGLAQAEVSGAQSTGSLSLHTQADSARVEWCTLGAPC